MIAITAIASSRWSPTLHHSLRAQASAHGSPGRTASLLKHRPALAAPNSLICASRRKDSPSLVADHIGGSARVVLYERRSRVVVIGGAFRSRLEKPGSRRRQRERPLLLRIPAEYALPARSGSAGASADRPLIGTRSTLEPQRLKNRSFQLLS